MKRSLASTILERVGRAGGHRAGVQVIKGFAAVLADESPGIVVEIAMEMWPYNAPSMMWASYLLHYHQTALLTLRVRDLEVMGGHADSWGKVDQFCTVTNTLWRLRKLSDQRLHRWAASENRWWRRSALVTLVVKPPKGTPQRKALIKPHGGHHDPSRVLPICELLTGDRDDMVEKAMSWVLRDLSLAYPDVVRAFVREHRAILAARVVREVGNKLRYGVKNPRRGIDRS